MKRIFIILAALTALISCSRNVQLSLVPYPDEVIRYQTCIVFSAS